MWKYTLHPLNEMEFKDMKTGYGLMPIWQTQIVTKKNE